MKNYDFIVVGAGIMGLSLAWRLTQYFPSARILVLEKEKELGQHASGRNSGVLHRGLYYTPGSLKALLCVEGARSLETFCLENKLPFQKVGKLILPLKEEDDAELNQLKEKATQNGAKVEMWDQQQIQEKEPSVFSKTGRALFSPETAIFDPHSILQCLQKKLRDKKVEFLLQQPVLKINSEVSSVGTSQNEFQYGHLLNAAGTWADQLAHQCGVGRQYRIFPFRGNYFQLSPQSSIQLKSLIYSVPDLQVPFLGVHFTPNLKGEIFVGPTAFPALGREHYGGITGLSWKEIPWWLANLGRQYCLNKQGFRPLVHQEIKHLFRTFVAREGQLLVPKLQKEHLISSYKVGIRAQLFDVQNQNLVMDFVVEQGKNSTHVLNAVSPAFTCALSFSDYVIQNNILSMRGFRCEVS